MLAFACQGGSSEDDGTTDSSGTDSTVCMAGAEGCACYPNLTCDLGLSCLSGLCVDATAGTSSAGDTTTAPTSSASTTTTTTTETTATTETTEASTTDADPGTETVSSGPSDGTESGGTSDDGSTSAEPDASSGSTGDGETLDPSGESDTGDTELPLFLTVDENGWVSRHDNRVGIQGVWFTYTSPMGGVIEPEAGELWAPNEDGEMCMSGSTDAVPCDYVLDDYGYYEYECDYENYWGVAGAFHICMPGEDDLAPDDADMYRLEDCPWADFSDVVGFSFRISGSLPTGARLVFDEAAYDVSPYIPLTTTGTRIQARFEDADDPDAQVPHVLDVGDITSVVFQVSASASTSRDFDFCIYDVMPIVE